MSADLKLPSRERLAASTVLVVGDAMLDRYLFGSVDRISPEAPVPVVHVKREEDRLGGAANVALNIKRLGAGSQLLTVVGNDDAGGRLQRLLEAEGVSALLGRDDRITTIVKLRVIGRSQQLLRLDFEEVPDHEVLSRMLTDFERALAGADAVLFSDYGKGGLTHIPLMIEMARKAGKPVLVDPKGSDYARYGGADLITPNRSELTQVIGAWQDEADLMERVSRLRAEAGIGAVLLTRSEEGMTLFDGSGDEGRMHIAADAREVFDVTGAGDTVIAVMAAMVACGLAPRQAVPVANKAGGIVVGKFGTASVSFEELAG